MGSIREQIEKWQRIRAALPSIALSLGQDFADTAVALRKENSIETGINKDGKPGNKVQYSDKLYSKSLLKGKEINQAGRNYTSKPGLGNWYGLRQAEGIRGGDITLLHTGQSWGDYRIQNVIARGNRTTFSAGITGPRESIFLNNVKRFGNFFLNTPDEIERAKSSIAPSMKDFIEHTLY